MSLQTHMAAVALSSAFLIASISANAKDELPCSPENVSGTLTLNNFQERIKSGAVAFKPMRETIFSLKCGARWSAEFQGDFTTKGPLDYDQMRLERARLTYRAGDLANPWVITAGYLGEHRFFEGINGSAGGRPDVMFGEDVFSLRVDNPDIVGAIVQKNFNLANQWVLSVEGSAFGLPHQDPTPANAFEDRGNSTTPSWTAKAKFSKGGWSFGVEGGQIQNGVLSHATENSLGVFAQYRKNLSQTLTWTSGAEIIRLVNFANRADQARDLSVAYSNLQWKPQDLPRLTLWFQPAASFDSHNLDIGYVELGARLDLIQGKDFKLSTFAAGDLEIPLQGGPVQWGSQVGLRAELGF